STMWWSIELHVAAQDIAQCFSTRAHFTPRARWQHRPWMTMAECVIADDMPACSHFACQCRKAPRLLPDHEERGPHVEHLQQQQHLRREVRVGTIVEGEIDGLHRLGGNRHD